MDDPILIHKAHLDSDVRIFLIVEPVKAALSKKWESGHGKCNGVRNAGFPPAISPVMTVGLPKVSSVGFS